LFMLPAFAFGENSPLFAPAAILGFSLGLFAAGCLCWSLGRSWNCDGPYHTFYWIRMEYWGALYLLVGLIFTIVICSGIVYRLFKS
jgi:hypothetical protein